MESNPLRLAALISLKPPSLRIFFINIAMPGNAYSVITGIALGIPTAQSALIHHAATGRETGPARLGTARPGPGRPRRAASNHQAPATKGRTTYYLGSVY